MSDLIKRSDAIEAIEAVDWYHQNRNKDMVSGANSDEHQAWYKADDIYKALESAPSIDLVRCAECRKVREDGGHANCGGYLYCKKWKTLVDEDCYCSWGEREDE